MHSNKEKYNTFCTENALPIYMQPWWLDAVAGPEKWDVVLNFKNEEVIAALPFTIEKKSGFRISRMPKLTRYLGVFIKEVPQQKYTNKISYQHKVNEELISMLPKMNYFIQNFHPDFKNWSSFYWKGFSQTTRYTYIIKDVSNTEKVFGDFRENIRREIRKAEKKLIVEKITDIETFYNLNAQTFIRQGMSVPYEKELLLRIDREASIRDSRRIYIARDQDNQIHASIYILKDNDSAYYLLGGANEDIRNSGAMSFLLWSAIKDLSNEVKSFNFEGSNIPQIERFFRAFGAEQTPYFSIKKLNVKGLSKIIGNLSRRI